MMFLLTTAPPTEGLSLDVNVLELMLFAFGLLVTIGVAITLFIVFTRAEGGKNHRGTEDPDEEATDKHR